MTRSHTVIDSPYGPLTLVATDGTLSALYMSEQRHRPPQESFGEVDAPDAAPFDGVIHQLDEYFAGERTEFDVPLRLNGTPFQRGVWEQLLAIPYGETRSYGQLADALGKSGASRAVGLANGKNPVSIIVPCHRVIGSTGGLTGYGGGLDRKQRLLAFEGAAGSTGAAGAARVGAGTAASGPATLF
ncbi:methylated-DNA--[protein]-cysteine S-methyltransferase [Streptomyces sp. NBC_01506]|uniref:methylated-DNA--[protein]-cysteine S-methyltransferase n=1 Tax=Streptomyces sp. NBC_01506 TaxID=2903887 RepID=UPI003870EAC7